MVTPFTALRGLAEGVAAPQPGAGGRAEARVQGVGLDVAQEREQVKIILDGEALVAALVEVARGRVVVGMVAADVGGGEPAHKGGEVVAARWAKDQMPVVGHQAQAQHVEGDAFFGLLEEVEKGIVVRRLMEDAHPAIAAVEHVIDHAGFDGARGAGHRLRIAEWTASCNKMNDPLSYLQGLAARAAHRLVPRQLELPQDSSR